VRLLLDTHAFLWMLENPSRLSDSARAAIADGGNDLLLSIGSCWEMAIKHAAGRLSLPSSFAAFMESELRTNRIELLPITIAHLGRLHSMPKPREHRDPFDRLLAAQSLVEGVPVASGDGALEAYGISRIW